MRQIIQNVPVTESEIITDFVRRALDTIWGMKKLFLEESARTQIYCPSIPVSIPLISKKF